MHGVGFCGDAGRQRVDDTVEPDVVLVVEQAEPRGEKRLQRQGEKTSRRLRVRGDDRAGAVRGVPVVPLKNGPDHGAHKTVRVQRSAAGRIGQLRGGHDPGFVAKRPVSGGHKGPRVPPGDRSDEKTDGGQRRRGSHPKASVERGSRQQLAGQQRC